MESERCRTCRWRGCGPCVRRLEGGDRTRGYAEPPAERGHDRRVHEALAVLHRLVADGSVEVEQRRRAGPVIRVDAALGGAPLLRRRRAKVGGLRGVVVAARLGRARVTAARPTSA
eukprot:4645176-Prymnesium_polylepis.1